jgi:hypothetical protein
MRACRKCGSTARTKPRGAHRTGQCRECTNRNQREWQQRHPGYKVSRGYDWRGHGWVSKGELIEARRLARAASQCEACERREPGIHNVFFADHSDAKLGGSGRFRGILCSFCNSAVGFHERRGWPLTPWLERYLSMVATRPPLAPNVDQLELLQ